MSALPKSSVRLDSPYWRKKAVEAIQAAPDGYIAEIREPKRSDDQNRKMWAMLRDISKQHKHCGLTLSPENWKTLFLHSLYGKCEIIPSLDGDEFVPMGYRSSQLTVKRMIDMIEVMHAFCAEHSIELREAA